MNRGIKVPFPGYNKSPQREPKHDSIKSDSCPCIWYAALRNQSILHTLPMDISALAKYKTSKYRKHKVLCKRKLSLLLFCLSLTHGNSPFLGGHFKELSPSPTVSVQNSHIHFHSNHYMNKLCSCFQQQRRHCAVIITRLAFQEFTCEIWSNVLLGVVCASVLNTAVRHFKPRMLSKKQIFFK